MHHTSRHTPLIETLEPRILYSADAAGLLGLSGPPDETHEQDVATLPAGGTDPDMLAPPLAFEENVGQADAAFDFIARGSGYTVGLSGGDAVIGFDDGTGSHVVGLNVVGGNAATIASGEGRLESISNYLLGSADQWHTDVANFGAVHYADVYDGIDLRYYGHERQLEYDFIVGPGADAGLIRLAFDGVAGLALADDGDLILTLQSDSGLTLTFQAPISYQDGAGGRELVASRYALFDDGTLGFELGAYDTSRALIIDPILSYGSYFGSSDDEFAQSVAVGADGSVYMAGYGRGAGLLGGLLGPLSGDTVQVTKYSSDLGSVVYSTVVGGSDDERANGVAVDAAGSAYVTGYTKSSGFPTVNALQSSRSGSQDAFVFKLNTAGTGFVYSTYLGGNGGADVGYGIALDAAGSAYVAGYTNSTNFVTTAGAADTSYANGEAFVVKLNAAGNARIFSSFVGGNDPDIGHAIAVDGNGRAVVVGETLSTNLPVVGAYQSTRSNNADVFVTQLNAAGTAFIYSTYLGGNGNDIAYSVALDSAGRIYVTGQTTSSNFDVTSGAFQVTATGSDDAFVSVFDPTLIGTGSLLYSTYLGGSGGNESGRGIAVDANGHIWVAGNTGSANFPVSPDAHQSTREGSRDGFVVRLERNGGGAADLGYGTYYGGSGQDQIFGAALGGGTFYIVGETYSSNGIASGGADNSYGGNADGFVAGFNIGTAPVVSLAGSPLAYSEGAAPLPLDATAIVSDADSLTLIGASIQIAGNYANGQDVLAFDAANPWGIAGAWNVATGTLTLSGMATVANYQAVLRTVTYHNTSDAPSTATRTLTVRVDDGDTLGSAASRQLSVTAVNDAPALGLPSAQTGTEDTPLVFAVANGNAISIADIDAGGASVQVTLETSFGRLTLAGSAGLSFVTGDGTSDTLMTFTGTLAAVNAALDGLRFDPLAHVNGATTITVQVGDLGSSGSGGPQVMTGSVTVNLAAVNDAPVNLVPGAQVTAINTALVLSQANGNVVRITDLDAGTDTVEITLSAADGTLALASTAGLAAVSGDGTATVTLSGTLAALDAALDGLAFTPTAAFFGATTITLTSDDLGNSGSGAAGQDTDLIVITVSSNVAPIVTTSGTGTLYVEDDLPVVIDSGLGLSDADHATLVSARVSVSANYLAGEDVLAFTNQAGISGSWDAASGTLSLSGTATVADYQVALRSVTYHNTSAAPDTTTRSLSIVVNDGIADSALAVRDVSVSALNDAPVNMVPGTQSSAEDGAVVFSAENGNQIRIRDDDAGSASVTVNLDVNNGMLSLSQTLGLTFTAGANGSASMSFSGTLGAINAALNGMRFDPDADFNGNVTLQIITDDLGSSGSGGALSDTRTVAVTITPGNDAPVLTASAPAFTALTEDDLGNGGQLVGTLVAVNIADVDAGAVQGIAITSLVEGNGRWEYSFDFGSSWLSIGTVSESAAFLIAVDDYLRYVPDGRDGTSASLSYRAWDQTVGTCGMRVDVSTNGGTSAFSRAVDTATISVSAVNDAPLAGITLPAITATAGIAFDLATTGLTVTDVDAGASPISATLIVGSGTLHVTPGSSGVAVTGSGGALVTLVGSLSQLNAVLSGTSGSGFVYFAAANAASVTDSLTFSVDDGAAGIAITTAAITIEHSPAPTLGGGAGVDAEAGGGDDGVPTAPDDTAIALYLIALDTLSLTGAVPAPDADAAAAAANNDAATSETTTEAPAGNASLPMPLASAVPAWSSLSPAAASDTDTATRGVRGATDVAATVHAEANDPGEAVLDSATVALDEFLRGAVVATSLAADTAESASGAEALARPDYLRALDRLRDGVDAANDAERLAAGSMVTLSTGVSAGYVAWLLRSGALLSSLLSSLPAWRVLDPFPVLARQQSDTDLSEEDDESLESIIEQSAIAPDPTADRWQQDLAPPPQARS